MPVFRWPPDAAKCSGVFPIFGPGVDGAKRESRSQHECRLTRPPASASHRIRWSSHWVNAGSPPSPHRRGHTHSFSHTATATAHLICALQQLRPVCLPAAIRKHPDVAHCCDFEHLSFRRPCHLRLRAGSDGRTRGDVKLQQRCRSSRLDSSPNARLCWCLSRRQVRCLLVTRNILRCP